MCENCISNSGIYRSDVISDDTITNVIEKLGDYSNRLIISGGEPTLYMDIIQKLAFLWKEIGSDNKCEKRICLCTNCYWADNEDNVENMLTMLSNYGIDEIILPEKSKSHDEFVSEDNINRVLKVNKKKQLVKLITREIAVDQSEFENNCRDISQNKIIINVHGDIQLCKEAYICYLGTIQNENYLDIFEYEFIKILRKKGIKELVREFNLKFKKNIELKNDKCKICRFITSEWKRQILNS